MSVRSRGLKKSIKYNWYEDKIEEPLRDLIKYLRNNGINTECSCAHSGNIQCQYFPDGAIYDIHRVLYNWFSERNEKINFTIVVEHKVIDGHQYSTLDIRSLTEKTDREWLLKKLEYNRNMAAYHRKQMKSIKADLAKLSEKGLKR